MHRSCGPWPPAGMRGWLDADDLLLFVVHRLDAITLKQEPDAPGGFTEDLQDQTSMEPDAPGGFTEDLQGETSMEPSAPGGFTEDLQG